MILLSKRLSGIAEEVQMGSRLADIGSDHALLPVFLVQHGVVTSAVAGELNPGPYAAAAKQVADAGLGAAIQVRQGNGLSVLQPGETDVVTIAGMGGALIVQILSEGSEQLTEVRRLVLQPNVGEALVRRWLLEHDWLLVGESLVEEDGKTYEILTADRSEQAASWNKQLYREREIGGVSFTQEWLLEMGPFLADEHGEAFHRKWNSELRKRERIERRMGESRLPSAQAKRSAMGNEIAFIREVLACWPTDKRSSD